MVEQALKALWWLRTPWMIALICSLPIGGKNIIKPTRSQLREPKCVGVVFNWVNTHPLPTQGWMLTYMRNAANEPDKKFGYMQISKDAVVSLRHLFTTLSTTKQQVICCCTVKLQTEPNHLKTGLLVEFTICTFECSGSNIMYNTAEQDALVPIYNEMKCNWLLGYKVKWASTGFQSSA